jgi:hypothetical protein
MVVPTTEPTVRALSRHTLSALVLLTALHSTAVFGGLLTEPAGLSRTTRTLRLARNLPLNLRATVGDIEVAGWNRPDVTIEIVRKAPTANSLTGISATVDLDSARLQISAVQRDQQHVALLNGSIVVHAPVDQPVEAIDLFEGRIKLRNMHRGVRAKVEHGLIDGFALSGSIRLETVVGDIRLERALLTDMLRLRAFNGNIALGFTPSPTNARILALSLGGSIQSDIPLNTKKQFGPRFGEATIGRGSPVVSIDVVSGDISITSGRS